LLLTVGNLGNSRRRVIDGRLSLVNHLPVGADSLRHPATLGLIDRAEDGLQICCVSRLYPLEKIQQICVDVSLAPTRGLTNLVYRNDPVVRIRHLGYLQIWYAVPPGLSRRPTEYSASTYRPFDLALLPNKWSISVKERCITLVSNLLNALPPSAKFVIVYKIGVKFGRGVKFG